MNNTVTVLLLAVSVACIITAAFIHEPALCPQCHHPHHDGWQCTHPVNGNGIDTHGYLYRITIICNCGRED